MNPLVRRSPGGAVHARAHAWKQAPAHVHAHARRRERPEAAEMAEREFFLVLATPESLFVQLLFKLWTHL